MSNLVTARKPFISVARTGGTRIIRRGLARGRRQIAFPLRLYLAVQLLRCLPLGVADRVLSRIEVDIAPYD